MKMHSVKENPKGLVFPRNIPRKRGNIKDFVILLAALSFLLLGCYFTTHGRFLFLVSAITTILFLMGVAETLWRICAVIEELHHLESRYDRSLLRLLSDVFMTFAPYIAIMLSAILFLVVYFLAGKNSFEVAITNRYSGIPVMMSLLLLQRVIKLNYSPLYQSLQFDELRGCDYGAGMANSFFHGYLRIMLPHTGVGGDKGLKEFQQDYEARNGIKLAAYKLFILIPMSQHCPPSLGSEFSPSVEPRKELESKEIDRAGVKNRNYKNSVYTITTKKSKKYVTAEYATPVKTLAEVMKQSTASARMYRKHRKEILLNFYLTLRDLLKADEDCCNLCEVIYYDDKNEKGELRDVGEVILSRLKQLKKNE